MTKNGINLKKSCHRITNGNVNLQRKKNLKEQLKEEL